MSRRTSRSSGADQRPSRSPQTRDAGPPVRSTLQRQYALATGLFVILVLGIIFLFGHLISRSLSRRYLEDVLMSGREEAQELAREIGSTGGRDLYEVVEKRRETLLRRNLDLAQKQVLESITVHDKQGNIVYTATFRSSEQIPGEVAQDLELGGSLGDQDVKETENTYEIRAPVGNIGDVVVGVSKGRLAERVTRLRGELLQQTLLVAGLTLITLVGAFMFVWHLIQRTRRLEAQRHAAEELAALGTLAANLAHEIRNPLNSINLNLELLEEDIAGVSGEIGQSVTSTRREVGRLARLVSDFLTYARPTSPGRDEVMVQQLLRDVVDFLRAEARNMGVHLRLAGELPDVAVEGDAGQLRQVVINLVLNAVQAVAELSPDRRVVELGAEADESSVSLVVRDRGPGLPPEELVRVREAFYTKRRGGTGLGLAIAERIARAHGGRVELGNLEPVGFEAVLVLPLSRGDGKMGADSEAAGPHRRRDS